MFVIITTLLATSASCAKEDPVPLLDGSIEIIENYGSGSSSENGSLATDTALEGDTSENPVDDGAELFMVGLWHDNVFINTFAEYMFLLPGSYDINGDEGDVNEDGNGNEADSSNDDDGVESHERIVGWVYASVEDMAGMMDITLHESTTYEEYTHQLSELSISLDMVAMNPVTMTMVTSMFYNLTAFADGLVTNTEDFIWILLDGADEDPGRAIYGPEEVIVGDNAYWIVLVAEEDGIHAQQLLARMVSPTHMHVINIASAEGNVFEYIMAHFGW